MERERNVYGLRVSRRERIAGFPRARREHGATLIEVMLSMSLLVVGVFGLVASIVSSLKLSEVDRETTVALQGARRALESMQSGEFRHIFRNYNDYKHDDVDGAGTGPGPHFEIAGLDLRADDPDGFAGRIEFPTAPGVPQTLVEDRVDESFGMPRDLNADGSITGDDRSADYVILPVRVLVEWEGISGEREVQLDTILTFR